MPTDPSKGKAGRKFDSKTVQYLYDRYVGDDRKQVEEFKDVVLNAEIARKIYGFRTKAGLSQQD